MKLIAPDYYTQFRCIADKCKHNCCIGWEIDVDADTLAFYRSVDGDFGRRLAENIDTAETPHFRLGENERCPFLDNRNLCSIISTLGEDALCSICADHPRFRCFFDSRTEIGLGFCCEAAADIILNHSEPVEFITLDDDGDDFIPEEEAEFFTLRDDIINVIQERSLSFEDRINTLSSRFGISLHNITPSQWENVFLSLERLDSAWDNIVLRLSSAEKIENPLSDTVLEQLLVYFIWRHVSDALYNGQLRERIAFCLLSVWLIDSLCSITNIPAAEIARMYSAEIEYSDDNVQSLLDFLGQNTLV